MRADMILDPKNYPDRICCGMYEFFKGQGYQDPLVQPAIFNHKTGEIRNGGLHLRMHQLTPSGNISTKVGSAISVQIHFCPFCGAKLVKEEP